MLTFYQYSASLSIEFVNVIFMTRQKNLIQILMNFVAFSGVSRLDNLYVEATNKLKAVKLLLKAKGEDKETIKKALAFQKEAILEVDPPRFWGTITYPKPTFVRIVIIWYELSRFVYKCLYFYLFPYMVVPVSYWMYD